MSTQFSKQLSCIIDVADWHSTSWYTLLTTFLDYFPLPEHLERVEDYNAQTQMMADLRGIVGLNKKELASPGVEWCVECQVQENYSFW